MSYCEQSLIDVLFDPNLQDEQVEIVIDKVRAGVNVNEDNAFRSLVLDTSRGYPETMIEAIKIMFDAGGDCDCALIEELVSNNHPNALLLSERIDWNASDLTTSPTIVDLLLEWLAERNRHAFKLIVTACSVWKSGAVKSSDRRAI